MGHDLNLSGSCDVISHVTIRLEVVDFLWVIHCDHASIWHRYGDMAPQRRHRQTHTHTDTTTDRTTNLIISSNIHSVHTWWR